MTRKDKINLIREAISLAGDGGPDPSVWRIQLQHFSG